MEEERSSLLPKAPEDQDRRDPRVNEDELPLDDDNGKFKKEKPFIGSLPVSSMLVIIAEFAERCCYYAISAIYVLYMQTMLNFNSSQINATTSCFNFAGYAFVLLGGYVADRYFGRKLTIICFGVVYLLGLIILTCSASPVGFANFPYSPTWAIWGFILSLVLIAFGMGGIKANVGPLMADQLGPEPSPDELETAFRYFYWSINFGALIGMILSPLITRIGGPIETSTNSGAIQTPSPTPATNCTPSGHVYTSYYISFALFTGIFIFGIIAFVWGYRRYRIVPLSGSVMSKSIKLCYLARLERLNMKGKYWDLPTDGNHWLDWAKRSCDEKDFSFIDDLKVALNALAVFSVFPIYWLLYLQMTNTLVLQATMMYLPGGISADQMAAFDPLFLVFSIPLFDSVIFPFLKNRLRLELKPITRMTIGFIIIGCSMFIATGLQAGINASGEFYTCQGEITFKITNGQGVNVFAQVPIYFFVALSEIFSSITSLEYAYSQAPKSMKSLIMAYSLFQTALGSLLGLILTPVVTEPNFVWLFLSFGIAMILFGIWFYFVFREK